MVGRVGMVILMGAILISCSSCSAGTPPGTSPAPSTLASATPALGALATANPTLAPSITSEPSLASPEPVAQATTTPKPTATPAEPACLKGREVNTFAAGLLDDMARRDADALRARMGRSFKFVIEATDVDIPPWRPARATRELLNGLRDSLDGDGRPQIYPLAEAARVACVGGLELDRETGNAVLGRRYVAAFLATGWGNDGDEEAVVFIGRNASGRLIWRGLWYSVAGFERGLYFSKTEW